MKALKALALGLASGALFAAAAVADDFHGFDPANFSGAMLPADNLKAMVADAMKVKPPKNGKNYVIGFANLDRDITFCAKVEQGIVANAKAADVELVIADNNLDGATALTNAESFITRNVDYVIEFQTDANFGATIMQKMNDAGITVVAIDIPMPGATFFGADNYKAGRLAGEGLAKWVNDKWAGQVDYVLSLDLPQSGPIPAARMQGQLEGLQDNLKTKVPDDKILHLDSKNTQEEARKVVGDTLPKIPAEAKHVVAIGINDGVILGTIAAYEAAGRRADLKAVGQNADPSGWPELCKAEPDNAYYGSTAYFPEKYGDKIMPAMLDLLQQKAVPPSIYVDHVFVTRDNIKQYYPDACK